jgi:hypothetical protein
MHAPGKYAAAARTRNTQIILHHPTGAADLVTDQRPELDRQHGMHRVLNAISLRLVARRDVRAERPQRHKIAAGGRDGLGGFEGFVHAGRPFRAW